MPCRAPFGKLTQANVFPILQVPRADRPVAALRVAIEVDDIIVADADGGRPFDPTRREGAGNRPNGPSGRRPRRCEDSS